LEVRHVVFELFLCLALNGLAEGSRELLAWQVEKGKTFSVGRGKIIGRLNENLDDCLSNTSMVISGSPKSTSW
jgi:hypothetical protein